ncbi:hypothetical protein C1I92_02275 [Jiangella anatolica]|uniref:Uncharacterized protein n=1 Tax=Jiangella anatolica TaxID=2670374 RepID=A0A2W2BEW5_9ACTN|nr:hypothetical protein C1I92_02275 [Jiangella anatolica]
MFALVALGASPGSVTLKCDPYLAADLRTRYPAISAGYQLNSNTHQRPPEGWRIMGGAPRVSGPIGPGRWEFLVQQGGCRH